MQQSIEVRVYTQRQAVSAFIHSNDLNEAAGSQMILVCNQRGTDKQRT
jgi:hypothetical protein